jgi:hypothetical protein
MLATLRRSGYAVLLGMILANIVTVELVRSGCTTQYSLFLKG